MIIISASQWIQLLVPIISIVAAIVSAALTYYFTRKLQIKANQRQLKESYYMKFIDMLSQNTISDEKSYIDNLVIAINSLPLVCSSDVAIALEKFKVYSSRQNKSRDIEVDNQILTDLIKAMRKDLYGNKANNNFPTITLQGNKTGEVNET